MKFPRLYLRLVYRRIFGKLVVMSHRGVAWFVGPVVVSLLAVGLAVAGEQATKLQETLVAFSTLAPLFYMPLGFMLLTFILNRYFDGTQGSGIPQTIAEISNDNNAKESRRLSLRILIGKFFLTLGGLSIGASIGREGPTVQIGASVMHWFYGLGPFRTAELRRTLIVAGGAAGIASAFNTPLAGIMFAIEELSKKHIFTANSSTLVTVIVSGLISISLLGNYTYFGTSAASLGWDAGINAVLICGLVGGFFGGGFSKMVITFFFNLPEKAARLIQSHKILFAGVCGFLIAILGILSGGTVYGTGYEPTKQILLGAQHLSWTYGLSKFIATLLSTVSGIAGGVFAPSLAVGAGLGDNLAILYPSLADRSAIILLVMAAYLSGVTRAPVTSFLIMMEMTNSHQMLMPLMAATVVASAVSKLICRTPLYHKLSERF